MFPGRLIQQLDAHSRPRRLLALQTLRNLERLDLLDASVRAGPVLPSYDHVHTAVSYGWGIPGIHSVARMIWAAHESRAFSTTIVEHESLLHCEESEAAAAIVNQDAEEPLRLAIGVEFKAPLAISDAEARCLSENLAERWGQGEAAWVVGLGAQPSEELSHLVDRFQTAKRSRAEEQLVRLNRHFAIDPPLTLSDIVTPEGNVTDRAICFHVAKAVCREADRLLINRTAANVRMLLNPDHPGHVPFPQGVPSYQEVVAQLSACGMTPTFTAQLRGQPLVDALPLLKSWGIRGLDVAGIEPNDSEAERDIQHYIDLAERHDLLLFGGSDYRGLGTGWQRHAAWMDTPLIRESLECVLQNSSLTALTLV